MNYNQVLGLTYENISRSYRVRSKSEIIAHNMIES